MISTPINFLSSTAFLLALSISAFSEDINQPYKETCPLNGVEYEIEDRVSIETGDTIKYFECVMSVHPMKQEGLGWIVEDQLPVWTPIKATEDTIISWF